MKRYALELTLLLIGTALLLTGIYTQAEAPAQLLLFKVIAVSAGLLHAHIAGKMLFPTVDWTATTLQANTYARIALYTVVPIAYTFAG
jgi:hypothetical protein